MLGAFVAAMVGKPFLLIASLLSVTLAGCTGTAGTEDTNQTHTHEASVGDDILAQLKALYTDQPFKGGQETPRHLFLDQGDGTYAFLHFNHVDVEQATGLAFVGDAFYAQGCVGEGGISQAQIDAGYVHFHKETSANWDAGHHADDDPNTMGYWFRHIAAADGVDPMGIGAVPQGEVYPLMPSHENAPACPTRGPLF